eukprot:7378315-Prymnesium_polylepis.1
MRALLFELCTRHRIPQERELPLQHKVLESGCSRLALHGFRLLALHPRAIPRIHRAIPGLPRALLPHPSLSFSSLPQPHLPLELCTRLRSLHLGHLQRVLGRLPPAVEHLDVLEQRAYAPCTMAGCGARGAG